MAANTNTNAIRICLAKDDSQAEIIIPRDLDRSTITQTLCRTLLEQHGIPIDATIDKAIDAMIAELPPLGAEYRTVIAQTVPPEHGKDGYIEWLIENDADEPVSGDRESHYERRSYVTVKSGQVIARVHEATGGTDGHDIHGNSIPAKPGQPLSLQLDDSVKRDADQLIARDQGVLQRKGQAVCIQKLLEIPEYVDFSTGNITFHGDVLVKQGVRDRFVIEAGGNVEVHGLIEAATIRCDGDLICRGGFAGRERGNAFVRGNLHAKYLDNIEAEIHGNMTLDREAINCDLTIRGSVVESSRACILGGTTIVSGAVHVGTLGSAAGAPTHVVLGSLPHLEPLADRLRRIVDAFQKRAEASAREQEHRRTGNTRGLCDDRNNAARGQLALDRLTRYIEDHRTVDLLVDRKLNEEVTISVGAQSFTITTGMRGPLRISRQPDGTMVYQSGDSERRPLAQIAELHARAA